MCNTEYVLMFRKDRIGRNRRKKINIIRKVRKGEYVIMGNFNKYTIEISIEREKECRGWNEYHKVYLTTKR